MSSGHFGKFQDALDNMRDLQARYHWYASASPAERQAQRVTLVSGRELAEKDIHEYDRVIGTILDAIVSGQRFFFPIEYDLTAGVELGAQFSHLLRLPFPTCSILSPAANLGEPRGWMISVCTEILPSELPPGYAKVVGKCGHVIQIKTLLKRPANEKWGVSPSIINALIAPGAVVHMDHVHILGPGREEEVRKNAPTIATLLIGTVCKMLVYLGVDRSSSEIVQPPTRLQAARQSRGKLPFLDYRVLVVDGDRMDDSWDRVQGDARRTHLRRGHIRRLHNSTRVVWVKNCIVHGKRPGIVMKDYTIKTKNRPGRR